MSSNQVALSNFSNLVQQITSKISSHSVCVTLRETPNVNGFLISEPHLRRLHSASGETRTNFPHRDCVNPASGSARRCVSSRRRKLLPIVRASKFSTGDSTRHEPFAKFSPLSLSTGTKIALERSFLGNGERPPPRRCNFVNCMARQVLPVNLIRKT